MMNIKALLILFLPTLSLAKCNCFEVPKEEPKKPVIHTVVIPATKPSVKEEVKKEEQKPKPTAQPIMDQIPDPDEPTNMKNQAIRAGVMCVAAVAVLYAIKNALSLAPIEQALNNRR